MPRTQRIILVGYDGVQGLDVLGPAEAFGTAARHFAHARYQVLLAHVGGGTVRATSGISLVTQDLRRIAPGRGDTVLVVGGSDAAVRAAAGNAPLLRWLTRAARVVRRVGSVCSGAFLLAHAGLLDGRRAATHWSACRELAQRYPRVTVDPDSIFVRDGKIWTSAGVTAGIDMALAMIEEDFGQTVADAVAAQLVVYARRPGFQSQFSDALVTQQTSASDQPLARAVEALRARPSRAFDVPAFAKAAGMSLRTLHRRCREDHGTTPAKLIERLRAEHARLLLGTTSLGTKTVAARAGFDTPARLNRVFRRTLGVTPGHYRQAFGH
jgi:transcriptional regulator GlxA family with amidase domain